MLRICLGIVLLVLMTAGASRAETYTWVDEQGTVNFTEDFSQVPKKYRKKAQIRGDMGPSLPAMIESTGESGGGEGSSAASAAGSAVDGAPKKEELYGGRSGESWKMELLRLKSDMESTNSQIEELSRRLSDTSGLSRTEYLSIRNSIKNLEYHRQELNRKLSSLNDDASRVGVPAEYR